MRVAVVTRESGNDRRYGMGRSWSAVADVLERGGHELVRIDADALDSDAAGEARRIGQRLRALGPTLDAAVLEVLARAWAAGSLAARVVREGGIDVVDCHDFMCAAGLNSAARRLGTSLPGWGYHQHSFDAGWRGLDLFYGPLDPRLRRLLLRIEKHVATSAKWVIFPAASAQDKCAVDLGLCPRPEHWSVLRHPVSAPALLPRQAARARLGVPPEAVLILGVGQIVPLKRFDCLVKALRGLPENCLLWVLGEGDGAGLINLARNLGVADRLRVQAVDDVAPWLAAADVYVSTSSTESFGMANAEAVSAGLPCLLAATGATAELFAPHALLLAPDLSDLQWQLLTLVTDAGARTELAAKTKGFQSSLPTAEQVADRLLAAFGRSCDGETFTAATTVTGR